MRLIRLLHQAIPVRFRQGVCAVPYSVLFVAAGAGCGVKDRSGIVAGCVTLDGRPLSQACVMFENAELAVARMATLDESGRYTVRTGDGKGLPAGRYVVRIVPGAPLDSESPTAAALLGGQGETSSPAGNAIPERYRSASTSGLTAEVQPGESHTVDFALHGDRSPVR